MTLDIKLNHQNVDKVQLIIIEKAEPVFARDQQLTKTNVRVLERSARIYRLRICYEVTLGGKPRGTYEQTVIASTEGKIHSREGKWINYLE